MEFDADSVRVLQNAFAQLEQGFLVLRQVLGHQLGDGDVGHVKAGKKSAAGATKAAKPTKERKERAPTAWQKWVTHVTNKEGEFGEQYQVHLAELKAGGVKGAGARMAFASKVKAENPELYKQFEEDFKNGTLPSEDEAAPASDNETVASQPPEVAVPAAAAVLPAASKIQKKVK